MKCIGIKICKLLITESERVHVYEKTKDEMACMGIFGGNNALDCMWLKGESICGE